MLAGFRAALDRLRAADEDKVAAFHALFEVVAWGGGIRDRLEGQPRPQRLDGLYYVRNVVLHQGADILIRTIASTAPIGAAALGSTALGGGGARKGWKWPPRDEFPRPRTRTGDNEYDETLARQDVVMTLAALRDVLPPCL